MNRPLHDFFTQDHRRIDDLLEKATKDPEQIDTELYRKFRIGLLTHIKMEENILFPAAKKANDGRTLPNFKRFRLDHAALTTLMALKPNVQNLKVLRHILEAHDEAEEIKGGMYEVCENLTQKETEALLKKVKDIPEVPVHPPKEADFVVNAAKRVVERAGYNWENIVKSL